MNRRALRRLLAGVIAMTVAVSVLAACGDDDADSSPSATDAPSATTAPPRRTGPAPVPLPQREKVVLANAFKSEYVAPIILAQQLGEFDKENLDVEIVAISMEDALPQMRNGQVDAANGAPNASLFNATASGSSAKWVLGNFFPRDAGDTSVAQTGLWARRDAFTDPNDPDPSDLEGKRVASAVGLSSVIAYPIAEAFSSAGADLSKVQFVQVPSADMVAALQNKAVDAAWLLDPFWTQIKDSKDFVLVATQPPGEPLGGIFFGERLLETEPEVGVAFLRALIRTVNTYLAGDYHEDDEVMQTISEITSIPVERIRATPSLAFDWEIRSGTTDRAQEYFREFGVITVPNDVPEDDVVDRSLYGRAVGAS